MAISSATHDVAADGFYLLALYSHQQAWFVGIRSTAYRMAMIAGQGLLVMLAGALESSTGLPTMELLCAAIASARRDRIRSDVSLPLMRMATSRTILASSDRLRLSIQGPSRRTVRL